ncbi:lanthionine synthetase C family protein [Streptomyces ipomoeae]|uniref:lanthionine synthetase C family protein n=1 Tax=Streptomyces ipomoeae TaxID=103232 RepID=UPI0029BC9EFC|nr:lanthionine synthetase C family protein [Streptomyces ipomoeae]MDX2820612.1 lanthionine synthetase C family protein [Streptomyces ipomoeae]MDX2873091.1 lanthionine synthetase C family protein [Streptomyces ipomoeae]
MITAISPAMLADAFARQLAIPAPLPEGQPWRAQDLAAGAAGSALLHIERARAGDGTWQQAHSWIKTAVATTISAGDTSGLYLGAPAAAFMLDCAVIAETPRYRDALTALDRHVIDLAHRRCDAARTRMRHGHPARFHEYDLFYGLTGIGAYLLRRSPSGSAMSRVLDYLVRLTRPIRHGDLGVFPGWWVDHQPDLTPSTVPAGHANLGTAHGITGPLLLLARALRQGVRVDGHEDAIDTILDWLDTWRQDGPAGPWWPEHLHLGDLRAGRPAQIGPARPSWCYGTPGIARAGQLAALARDDPARQRLYEDAMARCLTDSDQLSKITDGGLCHGWAGVYQTAFRAAHDATTPALHAVLPELAAALTRHARPGPGLDPGLLQGTAGTALALTTAAHDAAPTSGWDACLLID